MRLTVDSNDSLDDLHAAKAFIERMIARHGQQSSAASSATEEQTSDMFSMFGEASSEKPDPKEDEPTAGAQVQVY
jgi:hypothetical protein